MNLHREAHSEVPRLTPEGESLSGDRIALS